MKSSESGFINKISRLILRLHWLWILVTVAGTVGLGYLASQIEYEFSLEQMFLSDSPLRHTLDEFEELFGRDDNVLIIAHGADDIFSAKGYRRIEAITKKLEQLPYFEHVISLTSAETIKGTEDSFEVAKMLKVKNPEEADWPNLRAELLADPLLTGILLSKNGDATAISLDIKTKYNNNEGRKQLISEVEQLIAPYKSEGIFHLTGIPQLRNAFVHYMQKDQMTFTPLCILVVTILAFWLFRAFKANVFSILVIALTAIWTLGFMSLGGATINIITVVMPSLLMVMGMAYVTHFLSRYIEDTATGLPKKEALQQTTSHMFLPVLLTSFTTGVGFVSLLVLKVDLVRQFGLYSAIGLMIAFWLTLTLLPSLCLMSKPFNPEKALFSRKDMFGTYLAANDRFVKRHPWPVIVISLLLVVVATFFITKVRVDSRLMEESNPKSPEYAAHQFMTDNLTGIVPLEILVTSAEKDGFKKPENLVALDKLKKYILDINGIDYAFSFADIIKKINQAMHENNPTYFAVPKTRQAIAQYLLLYEGEELDRLVTGGFDKARIAMRCQDLGSKRIIQIEKQIYDKAEELMPEGIEIQVTGASIMAGKLMDRLILDMVKSLFVAAFIITILMAILFRSVKLGLLAMIPNFIPIVLTMGILGMLDITLRTSIVVVFSISLGIAVDDTIHFIMRFRDEHKATGEYDISLKNTFLGTGRPIIFTSLLLFLGFAVLSQSSFIPTRNFGLLSAITMVSALIGDLFLLPALLWVFKPKLK